MGKLNNDSDRQKTTSLVIINVGFLTVLLGYAALYMMFLVTGVLWPVRPSEQALLHSWGIWQIFSQLTWVEYLIPIILAVPLMYWLTNKSYAVASVVAVALFGIVFCVETVMSSLDTPLVVKNMTILPVLGWSVGSWIVAIAHLIMKEDR